MLYRLARSLNLLRTTVDKISPNRSKISDGWIGDARHRTRDSDHNPWVVIGEGPEEGRRIVTAIDLTHDMAHGVDMDVLAEELVRSEDRRIKYIIWSSRIVAGEDGPRAWQWRRYGGKNPHDKHLHISVEEDPRKFDNITPWNVRLNVRKEERDTPALPPRRPTLRMGDKGNEVLTLQRLLNAEDYQLATDGDFGPKTDRAVRQFQTQYGTASDGVVGPYTWELLES